MAADIGKDPGGVGDDNQKDCDSGSQIDDPATETAANGQLKKVQDGS